MGLVVQISGATSDTYAGLDDYVCRLIDKVKVKGKDFAVNAYEPLCLKRNASADLLADLDAYHAALQCYFAQEWDGAERKFAALLTRAPGTLLYQIYLERIALLREQNLAADWDGSYQHLSK